MSEKPFDYVDDHVLAGYRAAMEDGSEYPPEAYVDDLLAYAAWRVGYRFGRSQVDEAS